MNVEAQIRSMVDRETQAWDTKNAELLTSLFHPDMVWPWPKDSDAHDPLDWIFEIGRFHETRWREGWQALFDSHDLVHNRRKLLKISVSREADAALAVVDVDTLWRNKQSGEDFHWKGRASKGYSLCNGEWKLIFHTGLLRYPPNSQGVRSPAT